MHVPIFRSFAAFVIGVAAGSAVLTAAAQRLDASGPDWIQEKPVVKPSPVSPLPHWYEVRGGEWPLPLDTLHRLATLMEAQLADNPRFKGKNGRAAHAIQFRAEIDGGKRIVRLEGDCEPDDETRLRLSLQFQGIRGGGRCVFHAAYDPVADRLIRFDHFQI